MTENYLRHHAEQMEALRRDFQAEWYPDKAQMIARGFNSKKIVEKEIESWKRFLVGIDYE